MENSPQMSVYARAAVDFILQTEPIWFFLCSLPLFFIPSFDPSLNSLGFVGLLIALIPWLLRYLRKGYFTRLSSLDLPNALFIFSACLGMLPTMLPHHSLARMWVLIGSIMLYYNMVNNSSVKSIQSYLVFIAGIGLIVTLALTSQLPEMTTYPWGKEILIYLQPLLEWLSHLPKVRFDNVLFWDINRNSIAGIIMAILPLMWPLAKMSSSVVVRLVASLLTILFVSVLILVAGITAIVAICAGWIVVTVIRKKYQAGLSYLLIFLLFSIVLFTRQLQSEPIAYIMRNFLVRLDLWQSALLLIKDFPLSGIGLGMENWLMVLPRYALPSYSIVRNGEPFVSQGFMHAHNFYLQTWVEQGILGFVALVAIVTVGLVLGSRYLRGTQGFRQALVLSSFWSFIAYAIHSLVDSGPSSPGAIGLWIMLGLMVAAGQSSTDSLRKETLDSIRHKNDLEDFHTSDRPSKNTLLGTGEWFGLFIFLTLMGLSLIDSYPLIGITMAVGSGITYARASIMFHDTKKERNFIN